MLKAFYCEEAVKVGDETLRLVIDFRALDAIESQTQRSFDGILRQFTARDADIPMALAARVVWGLLRANHAEIDIDQALGLVVGPSATALGVAMGHLFETGFPRAAPTDAKAKPENPRKPRGTSKPSSSRGAAKG